MGCILSTISGSSYGCFEYSSNNELVVGEGTQNSDNNTGTKEKKNARSVIDTPHIRAVYPLFRSVCRPTAKMGLCEYIGDVYNAKQCDKSEQLRDCVCIA